MTDKQDADGYTVTGFISRNEAGDVRLTELGVTRNLSLDEYFSIMHPYIPRPDKQAELARVAPDNPYAWNYP